MRSVLEGVAFSQRQGLEMMRAAGAAASVARGAGGGLTSPVWRQILADALDVGLQLASPGQGAARGAAVLAGLGVGAYASAEIGVDWSAQPVQRPTAWLEICITAGTNTDVQKSAFIEAAFAELQHQLAPGGALEAASYVIVHELPAGDWGYGGRTQQARRPAASTLATPPPVP